jgi:hypothetical protein
LSFWWDNGRWTVLSTTGSLRDKTEEVFNVYVYSSAAPCSETGGGITTTSISVPTEVLTNPRDCAGRLAVYTAFTPNFEGGNLSGWIKTGTAFNNQPTYGDISFNRSVKTRNWAKTVPLGGDYWRDLSLPDRPWNNGRQGSYWIGTSDNHPTANVSYTQRNSAAAEGTLISPTFSFCETKAISFLVSGTSGKIQLLAENDGSVVEANATKVIRTGTAGRDPVTGREIPRLAIVPVEKIRLNGKEYFVLDEETISGGDFFGRSNFIVPEYAAKGIGIIRIIDDVNGYVNFDDLQFHKSERDVPLPPRDDEKVPLWGFVDMHTHLMSHLSMGGKVLYGAPDENSYFLRNTQYRGWDFFKPKTCNDDGPVRAGSFGYAFLDCNAIHGSPGLTDNTCGDIIRSQTVNKLEENYIKKFKTSLVFGDIDDHPHRGVDNWPHWSSATHQQMWWEWIKRAKEGGMRVMIALGVHNELLAKTANADEYIDDKSSVEVQLTEIKRFVNDHSDFMEIAKSAQDLRRIVQSNKLAVILGVETEDLGNLTRRKFFGRENITINEVRQELQNLYNNYDVRYIFPIHVTNNIFGGTALYKSTFLLASKYYTNEYPRILETNSDDIQFRLEKEKFDFPQSDALRTRDLGWIIDHQPDYPKNPNYGHKNSAGLTNLGNDLMVELMKMGFMIDIDHITSVRL